MTTGLLLLNFTALILNCLWFVFSIDEENYGWAIISLVGAMFNSVALAVMIVRLVG